MKFFQLEQKLDDYDSIKFFLLDDSKIIGAFTLYYFHAKLKEVVLQELYLIPECRRKNIGKEMLRYAVQYCKLSLDADNIMLWCDKNTGLPDYYKSFGFEYSHDKDDKFIWMNYKLAA